MVFCCSMDVYGKKVHPLMSFLSLNLFFHKRSNGIQGRTSSRRIKVTTVNNGGSFSDGRNSIIIIN